MVASPNISWIGLAEYKRLIFRTKSRLPTLLKSNLRLAGKLVRRAIKDEIGPNSKGRAVLPNRLTGRSGLLRRSIGMSARIRSVSAIGGGGSMSIEVGPSTKKGFYGRFHEYGTGARMTRARAKRSKVFNKKGKGRGSTRAGGLQPRRFVLPAVVKTRDQVFRLIGRSLDVR